MSDTTPQPVSNGCRKYVKSKIKFNTFNTFNNVIQDYFSKCNTIDELNREHRRLVVQMHPDRNPGDPDATAKFQEMQAQYEERKAELNGDYSGSRRAKERRERAAQEERERQERERRQREASRVEHVINEARKNKGVNFLHLKIGDYVYARKVNYYRHGFECGHLTGDDLLRVVSKAGVAEGTVLKIEAIIDLCDQSLLDGYLCDAMGEEIYGGYEVLQQANPNGGVAKAKRVAKVVMFRSKNYCVFGNPMGDMSAITDYYIPINYEEMFSDKLHQIAAKQEREEQERKRIEAERKAELLAEQQPMIDEWHGKLITITAALTNKEREAVAIDNLKTMLKATFPGVKFNTKKDVNEWTCFTWTDGPSEPEVVAVCKLFNDRPRYAAVYTPWQERYGFAETGKLVRHMTAISKAKSLEQLASVTEAFGTSDLNDYVEVSDFDWMMLHLLVGVQVNESPDKLCKCTIDGDIRKVSVADAIRYIFDHTSYYMKEVKKQAA